MTACSTSAAEESAWATDPPQAGNGPSSVRTRQAQVNRQQQIVAAFQQAAVGGLEGLVEPPEHRITQVSHLFFTGELVFKLCRADNEAFNETMFDFSDPVVRAQFMTEDYALNRFFSPQVYLALLGVRLDGTAVRLEGCLRAADELVEQMRRLSPSSSLTWHLAQGNIGREEIFRIGSWLAERSGSYDMPRPLRQASFLPLMHERLADVAAFCNLARPYLTAEDSRALLNWLGDECERQQAWLEHPPGGLIVGLDCHVDNVYLAGQAIYLLDGFQIKPAWRAVDGWLNLCRLGADIWVLGTPELFGALVAGYAAGSQTPPPPDRVLALYLVYAALIRVVLSVEASQIELAARYLHYAFSLVSGGASIGSCG